MAGNRYTLGQPLLPPPLPTAMEISWWNRHRENIFRLVQGIIVSSSGFFVDQPAVAQAQMQLQAQIGGHRMSPEVFDQYAKWIAESLAVPLWKAKSALRSLLGEQAPPSGFPKWLLMAGAGGLIYFLYKKYSGESGD